MDDIWERAFALLKEYLETHNGIYPDKRKNYNGIDLYWWILFQRHKYKNGVMQPDGSIKYKKWVLTKEKIEKLNSIGFVWDTIIDKRKNEKKKSWDEMFEMLKDYLKEHNNIFPTMRTIYQGYDLYPWIRLHEVMYCNGTHKPDGSVVYKEKKISREKIEKLNTINFPWEIVKKDKWEEKFQLFKEYLETHDGNYPTSKEVKLYQWVNSQRLAYSKGTKREDGSIVYKSIVLTSERIEKLDSINFIWATSKGNTWEEKFNILKSFLKSHQFSEANVTYKGLRLKSWIRLQRDTLIYGVEGENGKVSYYSNVITPERIKKLQSIGFKWIPDGEKLSPYEEKMLLSRFKKIILVLAKGKEDNINRLIKKFEL